MPLSVEADLVRNALAGLEVLDDDQCVVVAGHMNVGAERPRISTVVGASVSTHTVADVRST